MMEKNTWKRVWNITTSVLVGLVVLVAVLLVGSRIFGVQTYTVLSGSMRPEYSEGDILYVKSVEKTEAAIRENISVGDPITFVLDDKLTVATHRVVAIDYQNGEFRTKGDANKDEDQNPVLFENLIGKPIFAIPLLGYVSDFVQSPPGLYVAIGVMILLIAAVFLPDLLRKKEAPVEDEQTAKEREELAQMRAELEAEKARLEALRATVPETAEPKDDVADEPEQPLG